MDKLFHHVGYGGQIVIEGIEISVVLQFPGVMRTNANIGLNDHGIIHELNEFSSCLPGRDRVLTRSGYTGFKIPLLHQ